jgi:hypothetical protein
MEINLKYFDTDYILPKSYNIIAFYIDSVNSILIQGGYGFINRILYQILNSNFNIFLYSTRIWFLQSIE